MKRNLAIILMAALALFGCQNMELDEQVPVQKVFTATIEDNDLSTKTSLDEYGNVLWKAGDQVSIFVASTINQQYQVTDASDGQTSASLNPVSSPGFVAGGEIPNNVAFYPYSSSNTIAKNATGYVVSTALPSVQNYADASFGNGAFPMAAVTTSTTDMNLKFKNVLGGLKLQLKGTASIASISVTGNNDEPLYGAAAVTLSTTSTPTINLTDASAKTVTLDCGSGVQLNESTATPFVIALPPMTMTGGFTVVVTDTEGKEMEIKTTRSQTINRSSILKMPAVIFEGTSTIKNLSENGTANCYIVNEYTTCQFDATKKGHTNETVGEIASAVVLWESFGTEEQPTVGDIISNVNYSDGKVSFSASGRDGNAVIAVKNANGTILWSWHIWVCEGFNPDVTAHEYFNNAGIVMDRNLGATSNAKGDVKSLGLLYQWGRKDPFLGRSSIEAGTTKALSTITWPTYQGANTIDYAIAHPTTFLRYDSDNKDWCSTGSSSNDNSRWNSAKGMYDPCPTGWRVPDGGSNGLWVKALGSSNQVNNAPWDATNFGMDFKTYFSNDDDWYPAAGQINPGTYPGQLQYVSYYGSLWSCTPHGNYAYHLYYGTPSYLFLTYDDNRAYGMSVRCVRQ